MVGALLVQQQVIGRQAVPFLSQLLQQVLVVSRLAFGGLGDPVGQAAFDQLASRLVALVEIDTGDESFEGGGEDRGGDGACRADAADQALAELEKSIESEFQADFGTGGAADYRRLDPGHFPLGSLGICPEQVVAHDQSQHGIAEELEPLVAFQSGGCGGGVRQASAQDFEIIEVDADGLLTPRQPVLPRQTLGLVLHARDTSPVLSPHTGTLASHRFAN